MTLPAGEPELSERLTQLHGLGQIREAAESTKVYLVGGAVRDLLLGTRRVDVDVAVEGEIEGLVLRLGGTSVLHERFSTATVEVDGLTVDLAAARSETYATPGALPEVARAELSADLGRRDFTVNAMAIPLQGEPRLIDPSGGLADLEARQIRILHAASFVDDPTRALRAARYAARLDFGLEAETERLVRQTALETVSSDRVDAELLRLCAEPESAVALELLASWGLFELDSDAAARVRSVTDLLERPPWTQVAERGLAVHAAAFGRAPGAAGRLRNLLEPARGLSAVAPEKPSEVVAAAADHPIIELLLARALGAEWLDRYLAEWRDVRLEITGAELLEAGVPEGPAVGLGLEAALRMKLDGEIEGRDAELAAAIAAAAGRG